MIGNGVFQDFGKVGGADFFEGALVGFFNGFVKIVIKPAVCPTLTSGIWKTRSAR